MKHKDFDGFSVNMFLDEDEEVEEIEEDEDWAEEEW